MLKEQFPKTPILGLTATATQQVLDDIIDRLGVRENVVVFQNSFNRPNLFYEIRNKDSISNFNYDIS